jgi:hypothetical protein
VYDYEAAVLGEDHITLIGETAVYHFPVSAMKLKTFRGIQLRCPIGRGVIGSKRDAQSNDST